MSYNSALTLASQPRLSYLLTCFTSPSINLVVSFAPFLPLLSHLIEENVDLTTFIYTLMDLHIMEIMAMYTERVRGNLDVARKSMYQFWRIKSAH